jgi:hypothetical protein
MTDNKEENSSGKDSIKPLIEPLEKLSKITSLSKPILQSAESVAKILDKGAVEIIAAAIAVCLYVSYWAFGQRSVTLYRNVFIASAVAAFLCFAALVWLLRKNKREIKEEDKKPAVSSSFSIPAAIKYRTAFGVSDGQIFKRLKRSNELDQLRAFADNEKLAAIVLWGNSGSGKTSLLRAGLEYSLIQDNVACVYLEAKPDNIEHIKSIVLETKTDQRLVVIIDQFEHLHNKAPEHKPFFDFVRKVCHMPPSHRVQLVIAFNVEYGDEWVEFETAEHLQVPRIPLKPFSAEEAIEIIETVLNEANLTVEEEGVRQYVQNVADDAGVSPVAIGIGLLVMANWAQRQRITAETFENVRGAEGIFTEYVRHWIEDYIPEDDQKVFLASLHRALVSAEGRTTLGETAEAIANASKPDREHVTHYLDVLASSEARILEKMDQAGKCYYRLANPQFIPAITGLLIEIEQKTDFITGLFNLHYKQWKRDPRDVNLLRGKDFKEVEVQKRGGRFKLQGPGIDDKAGYLDKSRQARHRRRVRIAALGASILVVLVVAGGRVSHWLDVREMHSNLTSWQLPPDLFERQSQLTSISVDRPGMQDLTWLRSSNLKEVAIKGFSSGTLNGIENLAGIQKFDIDFGDCETAHLGLQKIAKLNLTDLKIDHLGRCKDPDISGVANLRELKSLSLDLKGSTLKEIPALDQLAELRTLTLNCKYSKLRKLPALTHSLRHLELFLDDSEMSDLSSLSNIDHLESIALSLNESAYRNLPDILKSLRSVSQLDLYINVSPIQDLPDLKDFQGLSTLTLHLERTKSQSMANLNNLQGIQQLALFLEFAPFSDLDILKKMSGLKRIEFHVKNPDLQQLPRIFDHMENVILDLNTPLISRLPDLDTNDLQGLEISLGRSNIGSKLDVAKAAKLKTLKLDLFSSAKVWDLTPLADFGELTTATLHLTWSQASEIKNLIPILKQKQQTLFPKLKHLALSLGGFGNQDLMFLNEFKAVEDLTLNLDGMDLKEFPSISGMINLQHLKLNLERSQIQDLSALSLPSGLQTLDLDIAHSDVQTLPDVTKLKQLNSLKSIKLDVSHSKIGDLSQIRALPMLEELTVDSRFLSLKELPPSVRRLNFVQ